VDSAYLVQGNQWRDIVNTEMKSQASPGWSRGTFFLTLHHPDTSFKDTDMKKVFIAVSEHSNESGHRIKFHETKVKKKGKFVPVLN
jgi:hypothetical protein